MSRKTAYDTYLNSEHWRTLRKQKITIHPACENCSSRSLLHVHHINYRDLTNCDVTDLAVLCENCHYDFHDSIKMWGGKVSEYQVPEIRVAIAKFRASGINIRSKKRAKLSKGQRRLLRKKKKELRQSEAQERKSIILPGTYKKFISMAINTYWKSSRSINDASELSATIAEIVTRERLTLTSLILDYDSNDPF